MADIADLFPNGAWDVHYHIFERICPIRILPHSPTRHLTPPPATVSQFEEFKKKLGITKSVLTHGLSYGSACPSLRDFVSKLGTSNTKAIGVIDPETVTPDELHEMQRAGVCGSRDVLRAHVKAIKDHCPSWSMAFTHVHPEFWTELKPFIDAEIIPTGIRLVTAHFALLKGSSMLPCQVGGDDQEVDVSLQPGFQEIIKLMRAGHLYVKISAPYRVSTQTPRYEDLRPRVRAFFNANPRQVVWGSDWPHTPQMKVRTPEEALIETPYLEVDDLAWLRSLRSWLSNEEWHALMVANPSTLYS
ncbi:uncharacterized protein BDW70DRAFT_170615 [Aspergillus foveolatus]|uniref:uncharacterized protein n=1 Tax=Aspergillus foveolatus TaxID=210207 RepID=UPI003CCDB901